MARIKLQEQPCYEFTYEIAVQARDLSSRGHLGSDAIVQILHEAVVNMFRALGLSETDLGDGRTGIISGDTVVNFKTEAYLFDNLSVESHIDEIAPDGFRVFHRVSRTGKLIALVETGLIGFDYTTRAIAPIPQEFNRALLQYSQGLQRTCSS